MCECSYHFGTNITGRRHVPVLERTHTHTLVTLAHFYSRSLTKVMLPAERGSMTFGFAVSHTFKPLNTHAHTLGPRWGVGETFW